MMRMRVQSDESFIDEKASVQKKKRLTIRRKQLRLSSSGTGPYPRCDNRRPAVGLSHRGDDTSSSSVSVRVRVESERRRSRTWIVRGGFCR